ncbi:MAG TPA: hypothetical protein VMZ91_02530, partial [Candidatus Paceibacterota bacterium]|nr:hypothetical protein [Candidatus Paceibacterota bacterium]
MTETQQTGETSKQNRSFSKFYDKNYKLFLILPAILLILSLGYLFYFYSQNNDIIKRDVSLLGGTTITINDASINIDDLNQALSGNLEDFSIRTISDLRTGEQQAVVVQTISDDEKTKEALENFLGY